MSLTERGLRDTLYDIRRLLAFADTVGMPRAALAPLILGHPDAVLECDNDVALWGADTENADRRVFSTSAAGLAAAAVLPMPDRVDRAHVRYLQVVLARLRTQDDTVGGGAVLPQALRHLAHARRMLDESDYSAAVGRELLVVTDEIYEKILFDGRDHVSPASLPGCAERTMTVNGFSKSYAMTGWRLGYVAGPADLIREALKVQEHTVSCAASFAQRGGIAALTGSQEFVREMVEDYTGRWSCPRLRPCPVSIAYHRTVLSLCSRTFGRPGWVVRWSSLSGY